MTSWYTSGQNDQNIRYFLLDSSHGSYETKRAAIESLSPNYTLDNGAVANTKVVRGYVTDAEIASNGLDIGGAVLDRVHNFVNPNAAAVSIYTNQWGDKYPVWGKLPQQPQALPTTPIDRLVQWWKDGVESVVYVAETAHGTGDGLSYSNRKAIHDICTNSQLTYDIIIGCGLCGRHVTQGSQAGANAGSAIIPKAGTPELHTIVMSHPVDQFMLMGGVRMGSGSVVWGDGAWTNYSGTAYQTINTSGFGGGQPFAEGFVLYWNGSEPIPLTRVTGGSTEVAATLYTFDFEESDAEDAGSAGSKYWVNVGGDPTNTVYIGGGAVGGIAISSGVANVDWYGVKSYQSILRPFANDNCHFYGCYWGYSANRFRSINTRTITYSTGAMPDGYTNVANHKFIGCETEFFPAGFYNGGDPNEACETGLIVEDHYFHNIGILIADSYGVLINHAGDSHSMAVYGSGRSIRLYNFCCEDVAAEAVVWYIQPFAYTVPSGGLELTDGYVYGLPRDKVYVRSSDGKEVYCGACRNTYVGHGIIRRTVGGSGMVLSFNGTSPYDGAKTQLLNNVFEYIIIEDPTGGATDGALRSKWCLNIAGGADHRTNVFRYITVRGAPMACQVFNSTTDENGLTVESSIYMHHCDIHASGGSPSRLIYNVNHANASRRKREWDYNVYRIDNSGLFDRQAGEVGDIDWWKGEDGNPLGNDIQDPNSTATTLTTDTGSPSLTITGNTTVGSTLTLSVGTDPDGTTQDKVYQWFRNGTLIDNAEGTTLNTTGYDAGDEITVKTMGNDGLDPLGIKGKWFLVTSNTVTLEDEAPAPPGRKYRYRVRLEDGTIIEAKSYSEAQRLKRQYATRLKAPEVIVKKARKTVVPRVERVEIRPKEVYAVPIKDPLIIDLKGDPNALLAKIRLELDDDDEAIQIAMDLL